LAVLVKQVSEPLPRQFVLNLPKAVEKVIIKALAKKPEDRYQNMDEFAIALDGLTTVSKTVRAKGTSVATVKRWITIIILLGLLGIGLALGGLLLKIGQQGYGSLAGLATRTSTPVDTSTMTIINTFTPTPTITRTPTLIFTPTFTPFPTNTPTNTISFITFTVDNLNNTGYTYPYAILFINPDYAWVVLNPGEIKSTHNLTGKA